MKRGTKRYLALLLSIIMVFSTSYVSSNASVTNEIFTKISTAEEFVSGQYVMVANTGYAVGPLNEEWLGATYVTATDNTLINPDNSLIWNINITDDGVMLTDANEQTVKPTKGNKNGIEAGDYAWDYELDFSDETLTISFKGIGEDTVTLASNINAGNRFRAYRNSIVSSNPSSYSYKFTLYKNVSDTPSEPAEAKMPTASIPSGEVATGSAITLSCPTPDASIYYYSTADCGTETWREYTDPIIIHTDTTIYAKAVADGYEESDIADFHYVIKKSSGPVIIDPVPDIPDGIISILDATKVPNGESVTVVGQLVYRFGNFNSVNTAILEDVIDGQIYGLQIYNALSDFEIGDVIKVTGTKDEYYNIPQLKNITAKELVIPAVDTYLIPAQEFASISDLLANKDDLLSEWVLIRDVILGLYNGNGSTTVKDKYGATIPIYRAATYPAGARSGDQVDLYACLSKYEKADQLRVGATTDYVITKDTKGPSITMPAFENAQLGKDYKISVTITDDVGVYEAKLVYTVNGNTLEIDLIQDTSDNSKWEATIPGSTFTKGITGFSIYINAKDTAGNETTSNAVEIAVLDEPQVIKVTPERNGKTGDEKRPLIGVTAKNLGEGPEGRLTLKKGESVILDGVSMNYSDGTFTYTLTEDLADGRYTALAVITRKDGKTINYEWPFTVGTPEYNLYFGQLHSHTTYSDGSGSLDDALNYVNNLSQSDNIDFVAFTDHSNYFDSKTAVNPEASLYNKSLMTKASQKLWNEYKDKVSEFNTSLSNRGVVALAGFEMTWSGGPGHINTWNTEGIVSRNNDTLNNKTYDAGLKAYYELLSQPEGATSVSQFNHPGTTFGTFSDFAYWDPVIDTRITLVEVGNGEGAIGSGGYFPSYSYYTMALDKGWHVAPTNNQDNHKGKWGNANDARDVIITDDFTEQGIYDALKSRRVYATEDKNLEITYTVNNELMGTIIKEVPENLDFHVTLNDPDDVIAKAEIIVNSGRVVYTWDVNAMSKDLSVTLKPDYSYYYIRVTEKDGDLAVTVPVWVGSTKLLGISNVESSTSTPVTNENLTVKTTLFNSESNDVYIKSITYKLDGTDLDTVTNAGVITKGGTSVIDYDFIPKKAKVQTITVEAVLTLDGLDYTFTKDLSLNVRDANKLVYIGIDGSHYNEYVAGNYKDSMSNFGQLAAEHNVRCVVLKTSEELIEAAKNTNGKYKMLVLTVPSRRNGAALREPYATYSDEEIEAIKGFAEAGGSLIICGWSDYYENYKTFPAQDQMAAQQNKLLKAVGATLRISDDGAYDDILNAGGSEANKARLYLTTYNFNNPFTKGIIFDPDHEHDNMYTQRYSQYGGSTIYVVDKDGNPMLTLPSNVSPIVFGHKSTYSKDCDNDGLGGNIPKYEYATADNRLMVLASEMVTHANGKQSLIIAAGAAFLSNFEIQATFSDTNAELNYSNYTILKNIIQYVNPVQIDKIADVQKETEEGVKYTIEGIVTSNASGYDKNTAFFDCIYVQDETAGINAFPVAGDFRVGQKVQITGTTSFYQGERQINVDSITLIDSNITEVEPMEVTAKQINDRTYLGSLVKISGTIKNFEYVNGVVQTILVQDKFGDIARIFIDGYITTDKVISNLVIENEITAVGLSSYDNTFDGLPARIRIRDRGDIVCTANITPTQPAASVTPTPAMPTVIPSKPTPEEEPVTPTPTPTPAVPEKPETEIIIKVEKIKTTYANSKVYVYLNVSEEALKDAVKDGKKSIRILMDKETLEEIDKYSNATGLVMNLNLPAVKNANINSIVLSTDTLLLAKKFGQNLTVHVKGGYKYVVDIPFTELKKVKASSKDLNIMVTLNKDTKGKDTKDAKGAIGILTIGTKDTLTFPIEIKVPISDKLSLEKGSKVYIYHKNPKTGKLEEVPNNPRTVAKDGTITLSTLSGGEFSLCKAKVKDVVTLLDRVNVSVNTSVKKGKKIKIKISLPQELVLVTSFKNENPLGKEMAKVTYKVSNKEIVAVSGNGIITAKKRGTVKITVTIIRKSGQKKSFSKTIKVK